MASVAKHSPLSGELMPISLTRSTTPSTRASIVSPSSTLTSSTSVVRTQFVVDEAACEVVGPLAEPASSFDSEVQPANPTNSAAASIANAARDFNRFRRRRPVVTVRRGTGGQHPLISGLHVELFDLAQASPIVIG